MKTTPAGRIDASTARSALAAALPAWRRDRAAKMPESTVPIVVISVTRIWVQSTAPTLGRLLALLLLLLAV